MGKVPTLKSFLFELHPSLKALSHKLFHSEAMRDENLNFEDTHTIPVNMGVSSVLSFLFSFLSFLSVIWVSRRAFGRVI